MVGSPSMLERAYEAIREPISIDYAVMEGAARDGRVVMGAMDVGWSDLGSWTALLGGDRVARRRAPWSRPARPSRSATTTSSIRRVDGRLGVIAPLERGSMTATQPIAVLRGAAPDIGRVHELIDRCAEPGG